MDSASHLPKSTPLAVSEHSRKRLIQACLVCRRKKTKCDGVKPTCGNCKRLKQSCSYGSLQRKPSARQTHIDILEQRLQEMEKKLLESRDPTPPPSHQRPVKRRRGSNSSMASGSTASYKITTNRNPTMASYNGTTLPPLHVGQCLTSGRNHHKVIDMDRSLLPSPPVLNQLIQCYLKRIYGVSPFFYRDDLLAPEKTPVVVLMAIAAATAKYCDDGEKRTEDEPPWLAGEPYAQKIRQRINDIVDMPSISHVQVMMFMIMHEFGCARGTRAWMYCGIAGRMALELGLQKEPTHLYEDGEIMTVETWKKNELRRNVFWGIYIFDRFGGASSARPVLFNDRDIDCHLPCHDNCLEQNTFSSESLDGSQLVWYQVMERDSSGAAKTVKLVETVFQDPVARSRCNLGWPTHMVRITSLFAKVAHFVNRTVAKSNSPLAPYDPDCYDQFSALSDDLDLWCHQLPLNMRNTPANLQRYRLEESRDTHRFLLSHILHSALTVFLNRPALSLIGHLDSLEEVATYQVDAIQLGVEKCLAASDNVSIMLTDINLHVKLVFSFLSYLTYSTATVVVHTLFSGTPDEAKKAVESLKSYCEFLKNMRKYYAMADLFFFRLHDFYSLYKNQVHTRQEEEHAATLGNGTADSSLVSDTITTLSYASDTPTVASLPNDSRHQQNIAGDILDHLLNDPLDLLLSTCSDSETMNWSLEKEAALSDTQRYPPVTSINTDMYSIWPCPTVDDFLEANSSDRVI